MTSRYAFVLVVGSPAGFRVSSVIDIPTRHIGERTEERGDDEDDGEHWQKDEIKAMA